MVTRVAALALLRSAPLARSVSVAPFVGSAPQENTMLRRDRLCVHNVHRESMHGSVVHRIVRPVRPATPALVSMLLRKDVPQVRTRLDDNNHAVVVRRASNVLNRMLHVLHAAQALIRWEAQRVALNHRLVQRRSQLIGFLSHAHQVTRRTHRR